MASRFLPYSFVVAGLALVLSSCGGESSRWPTPHQVTVAWAPNHEKGVNSTGGGYQVTISGRRRKAAATQAVSDRSKDEEGVFLARKGKAHFVPVAVGIAGRDEFEVLKGLNAGDSVIAGPYEAIRGLEEGKPIRRAPEPKKGAGTKTGEAT